MTWREALKVFRDFLMSGIVAIQGIKAYLLYNAARQLWHIIFWCHCSNQSTKSIFFLYGINNARTSAACVQFLLARFPVLTCVALQLSPTLLFCAWPHWLAILAVWGLNHFGNEARMLMHRECEAKSELVDRGIEAAATHC